jgi:hypothetical protein
MSLATILLLTIPGAAPPAVGEWGAITGRVVFDGDKIPENPKVNVTSDKNECLSKGPILANKLVIDSKTKRECVGWPPPSTS